MATSKICVEYEDSEVKVTLEDIDGYLFVHCTVHKHSPSIIKRLKKVFEDIKQYARDEDYDGVHTYINSERNTKFVKVFKGAQYLETVSSPEGTWELYKWQL